MFDLQATELQTGIRLVEAVAADRFQAELMMVTDDESAREKIREAAIEFAKLGVVGWEDASEMVRVYMQARLYDLDSSDIRHIGQVRMRGAMGANA